MLSNGFAIESNPCCTSYILTCWRNPVHWTIIYILRWHCGYYALIWWMTLYSIVVGYKGKGSLPCAQYCLVDLNHAICATVCLRKCVVLIRGVGVHDVGWPWPALWPVASEDSSYQHGIFPSMTTSCPDLAYWDCLLTFKKWRPAWYILNCEKARLKQCNDTTKCNSMS